MMNSYLKEENIIGCIDLNDNNEIRSNTLAQLKRFKKYFWKDRSNTKKSLLST